MMEILWFFFRAELWMDGRMFTSLQNNELVEEPFRFRKTRNVFSQTGTFKLVFPATLD